MISASSHPGVSLIRSHTGLRGIAAFSVLLVHLHMMFGTAWGLSFGPLGSWFWGWPAVDLFFILSGYILNHVYIRETQPVEWRSYLIARVARIMPLYYLTLFVAPVAGIPYIRQLFRLPQDIVLYGYQYAAIMIANMFMVAGFIDGGQYPANGPSWSISVEMLLYVTVFPILAVVAIRMNRVMVWAAVVLFTLVLYVSYTGLLPRRVWGWSWVYIARGIAGFTVGFLLCHMNRANMVPRLFRTDIVRRVLLYGLAPAVYLLAVNGVVVRGAVNLIFPVAVLYTATDRGLLCGCLKAGIFQWLGDRSYSIYLWHYPIFVYMEKWAGWSGTPEDSFMPTLRSLAMIAVVLVVSTLSYKYFEIPVQRLVRRNWSNRRGGR